MSALTAVGDHHWQSTLFAALALLAALALRRHRARVRYALLLTASLKFLVPFAALVVATQPEPRQPRQPNGSHATQATQATQTTPPDPWPAFPIPP